MYISPAPVRGNNIVRLEMADVGPDQPRGQDIDISNLDASELRGVMDKLVNERDIFMKECGRRGDLVEQVTGERDDAYELINEHDRVLNKVLLERQAFRNERDEESWRRDTALDQRDRAVIRLNAGGQALVKSQAKVKQLEAQLQTQASYFKNAMKLAAAAACVYAVYNNPVIVSQLLSYVADQAAIVRFETNLIALVRVLTGEEYARGALASLATVGVYGVLSALPTIASVLKQGLALAKLGLYSVASKAANNNTLNNCFLMGKCMLYMAFFMIKFYAYDIPKALCDAMYNNLSAGKVVGALMLLWLCYSHSNTIGLIFQDLASAAADYLGSRA